MGKKKIKDWIVIDANKGCMRCERCGKEEYVVLPARVEAFLKRCEAFGLDHEGCKEVQ